MIEFSEQFNQLADQQRLAGRYTPASAYSENCNKKNNRLVKAYDHYLDRMVAVKHGAYNAIYHEFETLNYFKSPYIVKAYELLSNPEVSQNNEGMVIEWLEGTTFAEYICRGKYSKQDVILTLTHLTKALEHCHNHGVIHGDVKPSNCMWNNEKLILVDFSAAKPLGIDLTKSENIFCTPSYAAPDVLTKTTCLTTHTDWFSVAVIAHLLLERKHPFDGKPIVKCSRKELKENSMWFDWTQVLKRGGMSYQQWDNFLRNYN